MIPRVTTAGAVGGVLLITVAQVLLPAALDLVGSIALAGISGFLGWKLARAQA